LTGFAPVLFFIGTASRYLIERFDIRFTRNHLFLGGRGVQFFNAQRKGVSMKPRIDIFCCTNSSVLVEEDAGRIISEDQAQLRISRLPCSGRTDVLNLLKSIETGATMTMVVGCPEDQCQFLEGSQRARMRVGYANRLLAEAGLGKERIRMVNIAAGDELSFAAALRETVAKAREMGSWGTREAGSCVTQAA
jgi:coenzyme F420-reducing hydrogenase delta subunit